MQTIEEYKAYTKQLESRIKDLEERNAKSEKNTAKLVSAYEEKLSTTREIIETCSSELEELRKHELQWDLDKARIKELEACIKKHIENFA